MEKLQTAKTNDFVKQKEIKYVSDEIKRRQFCQQNGIQEITDHTNETLINDKVFIRR